MAVRPRRQRPHMLIGDMTPLQLAENEASFWLAAENAVEKRISRGEPGAAGAYFRIKRLSSDRLDEWRRLNGNG